MPRTEPVGVWAIVVSTLAIRRIRSEIVYLADLGIWFLLVVKSIRAGSESPEMMLPERPDSLNFSQPS
jgi:hypothetical protein